jgi:hypothetical protein
MEAGIFEDEDIDSLKIEPEDFEKALNDFAAQSKPNQKERTVVGYKRDMQPQEQNTNSIAAKHKAVIGFRRNEEVA